ARLVKTAKEQPLEVGVALLASAEAYTPRATKILDEAREELGTLQDVAMALAENLPAPKTGPSRKRRRRRKKRPFTPGEGTAITPEQNDAGEPADGAEAPAEGSGTPTEGGGAPTGAPTDGAGAASDGAAAPRPKRRRRRRPRSAATGDGGEPQETPSAEPAQA
ncbi:MAG TPA: hypothetical protein VG073_08950, partial [Gaiellaceae bacterium]|nr:hypothetical protein [Gaiellaceae bacterium]